MQKKMKMKVWLLGLCILPSVLQAADLIKYMGSLQYYTQKTWLSVNAKNPELAHFYAHEMEATIKDIQTVESFDGFAVGKLATGMLVPKFEKLEAAINAEDWKAAEPAFSQLINACNSCHDSTSHGFVNIQFNDYNPYMQSFDFK